MNTEAAEIRELVMRWGWNATAFQSLEPGYRYFRARGGVVAYRDTGEAWVAAGAPLAPPTTIGAIAADFIAAATTAGRRTCFALVETRFLACTQLRSLQIGVQPVWDPTSWSTTLAAEPSLRAQIRRARKKGMTVRALAADELSARPMQQALDALTTRWLASRPMATLDFLVRVDLFSNPTLRRVFVAERDGELLAAAALVPVPERGGWLLEDLLRAPEAPNGTMELLVDAALHALAEDEVRWLTMGMVALSGDVPHLLRAIGRVGAPLYDFAGLAAFRNRLRPSHWLPLYVAYPDRFGGTRALISTLRALAGGSLRRFAARTVHKQLRAHLVAAR
jgi:lysylphosphatidylglycerol synthetase-like protein (DUF2156 family)